MTFSEKMKSIMDQGLAVSRDILTKAGDKAQQWGEMGVIKLEVVQLRSQAEKLTAKLGAVTYEILVEKGQKTVSHDTPAVRDLLDRLKELEHRVTQSEQKFKDLGGKEEDLKPEQP